MQNDDSAITKVVGFRVVLQTERSLSICLEAFFVLGESVEKSSL